MTQKKCPRCGYVFKRANNGCMAQIGLILSLCVIAGLVLTFAYLVR